MRRRKPAPDTGRTGSGTGSANVIQDVINELGYLDIALLGMGEDGHTASLFPGNAAMTDDRAVVPVYDAPKAPAERVSLGLVSYRRLASVSYW